MSKKTKIINTVPNGKITIYVLLACIVCYLFVWTICFFEDGFSVDMFAVYSVILAGMLFIVWHMIRKKYMNHICVSDGGISHKDESYTWDEVCITVMWSKSPYENAFPVYYAYFSNAFLSRNEIQSKEILKRGFYIVLTPKRAEFLFQYYKKRVELLEQIPNDTMQKIPKVIFKHNKKIEDDQL